MSVKNYIKNNYLQILSKIRSSLNYYRISDYKYAVQRFNEIFGYVPDLSKPKTFSEKINWRKLYDQKKIYKIFADKIAVRQYVKDKIGNKRLVKVLQIVDKPESINYANLPNSFIIKASHGSGWNKIVMNKDLVSKNEIIKYFKPILKQDYYSFGREWCYKDLVPRLLIEELLIDENGKLPLDYKFFCFNGVVKFIQVDIDRFSNHTRNLYDSNFRLIKCELHFPSSATRINQPGNFNQLKNVASKLSKGLDFLRVDLYSVNNKVYFGELTCYPGNGFEVFKPIIYDTIFGKYWKMRKNA